MDKKNAMQSVLPQEEIDDFLHTLDKYEADDDEEPSEWHLAVEILGKFQKFIESKYRRLRGIDTLYKALLVYHETNALVPLLQTIATLSQEGVTDTDIQLAMDATEWESIGKQNREDSAEFLPVAQAYIAGESATTVE